MCIFNPAEPQVGLSIRGVEGAAARDSFGFFFSEDVGAAICATLMAREEVWGKCINIAAREVLDFVEFVEQVANEMGAMGVTVPKLKFDGAKSTGLVSVDVGVLCIDEACRILDWEPTPLDMWLRRTVRWWWQQYKTGS